MSYLKAQLDFKMKLEYSYIFNIQRQKRPIKIGLSSQYIIAWLLLFACVVIGFFRNTMIGHSLLFKRGYRFCDTLSDL